MEPTTSTFELVDEHLAAQLLNTTPRHVRNLRERKAIPYFKVGRFVRYSRQDLTEFLRDSRVEVVG